jgi:hypothetical protein
MSSVEIRVLLENEFPGSEITIQEGYHNEIEVPLKVCRLSNDSKWYTSR